MKVAELAEYYRKKLNLLPWDQFEKMRLEEIESSTSYTLEAKAQDKNAKRRCGKTTRGLLLAIADAALHNKPLIVNGYTRYSTKNLVVIARKLVEKLELSIKVQEPGRSVAIFQDHLNFEM